MKTITDRLDLCRPLVFVPVPEDVFKATEDRIHTEQQILSKAGKDPVNVNSGVVDRILDRVFE